MLWLYLYLPYLSIESINRSLPQLNKGFTEYPLSGSSLRNSVGHSEPKAITASTQDATYFATVPLVVVDGPELRPTVYAINRAAFDRDIRIGMTLASAKVLHHDLIALPRNTAREMSSLKRIANALLQFTPTVSIDPDVNRAGIALEVSSSLRLFGGFEALFERVRHCVEKMRYVARYGVAPNAMAASLLARAARNSLEPKHLCFETAQLLDALSPLPTRCFAWAEAIFRSLDTLGLRTIGDVLRQPLAGLQKRFGHEFVLDLDHALGRREQVRPLYSPPEQFESCIDCVFEIKDAERLLLPMNELLTELEGFLRARGAGVDEIFFNLKQGRSRAQHLEFRSRNLVRSARHWLRLVQDRLDAFELQEPVIELVLQAHRIATVIEENDSLLPHEKGTRGDWLALLDRIASRVGEKSVYRIALRDDHRPERAWRSDSNDDARAEHFRLSRLRPAWLLRDPKSLVETEGRPQYNGALTLLAGPERIDTGWWDNQAVARDYFIASNPHHEICWIFRDYRQGKRWYLHGFFS